MKIELDEELIWEGQRGKVVGIFDGPSVTLEFGEDGNRLTVAQSVVRRAPKYEPGIYAINYVEGDYPSIVMPDVDGATLCYEDGQLYEPSEGDYLTLLTPAAPLASWRVRLGDGTVLPTRYATEEEAERQIRTTLRTMPIKRQDARWVDATVFFDGMRP